MFVCYVCYVCHTLSLLWLTMYRMTFNLYAQIISGPYLYTLTVNGVVLYVHLKMSAFIWAAKKAYGNQ